MQYRIADHPPWALAVECRTKLLKFNRAGRCQLLRGAFVEWATKKNPARGTGFFAAAEG
jgi:hypothetical protein